MRALILDCSPAQAEDAGVDVATRTVDEALVDRDVEVETLRVLDYGFAADAKAGEELERRWAELRDKVLDAEILLLASPATWLGVPPDEARLLLDGLEELLASRGTTSPPATNHVAGVIVSGDSQGGELVLNEMTAALTRIGFTVPGQAATYLNALALRDAPPAVRADSGRPGRDAAANLVAVARALQANPIPTVDDTVDDTPAEISLTDERPRAGARA
jgi:multimeric flavodoxin WrbA